MAETAADTSGHATAKVIVGAVRETASGERRVALTPETCKKLVAAGAAVRIQRGLGDGAHALDAATPGLQALRQRLERARSGAN